MIKVLQPGFYSTIQDRGRFGYQRIGVPVSGAMDQNSALLANLIIGNQAEDALLEATYVGPTLQFFCNTIISVTGSMTTPAINGKQVEMNKPLAVTTNDTLSFGIVKAGIRIYIAISGGILSPLVLGSRSFFTSITPALMLRSDDELPIGAASTTRQPLEPMLLPTNLQQSNIEVFRGPEFGMLNGEQEKMIFRDSFTVSNQNNRMGYLLNEVLSSNSYSIITSAVMPGTVQLTPSGKLIVLMRDCQTTGGYPRILQLNQRSIDTLSQKKMGNMVKFKLL